MKNNEHTLQVSMIRWFDLQYPNLRLNLFAVPNGSARHIVVAKKLKAEGVRSGVSDLIFCYRGRTIFIEVKMPKGRMQDTQKEFQENVLSHGFDYFIVRDLDQFLNIINETIHNSDKK